MLQGREPGILYQKPHFTTNTRRENILQRRVQQAFHPGTVPDKVIEEIAEQVAEDSGDCRKALTLLLNAGRKADRQGSSKVKIENLKNNK
jgi:cell division control protein 6